MNLIDRHIHRHLLHLQFEDDISFQKIYNLIQSEVKDKSRFLLQYIHLLLNETFLYITIEKYTIFQLKSIPVLIVCEDKKSYLNAG